MRRALSLGLLAVVLLTSTASAQKKKSAPPAAETPVDSADDEVARGLFQAGKAAYQAGKYADALSFFEQAHARSGRPELLFNIAQSAERVRQDQKALEMFRAYLTQVPNAANRVEVEARIKQLEQWVAEQNKEAAPVAPIAVAPTPAETAEQAPSSQTDPAYTEGDSTQSAPVTEKWWFWTGIGAVVVGGTAVALAVALGGDETEREPFYEGNGGSLQGP
jgi:tetratricopeptide (TPR) repeat protein